MAVGVGRMRDRRDPRVAATFEPDARIDYVFVRPSNGDGRGQVLDAGPFGTAPVGGVWASDQFGVLAMLRGGAERADRDSAARRGTTSGTGDG